MRPQRSLRVAPVVDLEAELPPLTSANQWTCRVCARDWVVPELARQCERKDLS